jgi:hypothetical protein
MSLVQDICRYGPERRRPLWRAGVCSCVSVCCCGALMGEGRWKAPGQGEGVPGGVWERLDVLLEEPELDLTTPPMVP